MGKRRDARCAWIGRGVSFFCMASSSATLSLSSTTKYINGHSDCLGGVVATNDDEWQEKMRFAQKAVGLNPSPFDCWLIARGVKTLSLRMRQHHDNALAVARHLEGHPRVRWVRHPFLPTHPQHAVAVQHAAHLA